MTSRGPVLAALPALRHCRCRRCACRPERQSDLASLHGSHMSSSVFMLDRCACPAVIIGSNCSCMRTDCLHEMRIWEAQPPFVQVAQALAVSMNKLGDQRYLSGDLHRAKQHYTEALRARQGSCCSSQPASVEAQLGIVTSLLKVLDIEQVG